MYQIIENSIDYVDITMILSRYNIDTIAFTSGAQGNVHKYYLSRMLHAAIMAFKLPNGHIAARHKYMEVFALPKVIKDSYEDLNNLRHHINRIKSEILLMEGHSHEYPSNTWIDAFRSNIKTPADSKTTKALEYAIIEHASRELNCHEFMNKVIEYVRITMQSNLFLDSDISENIHNSRIQVIKNLTKCEFCAEVKKYVYKDLKGLYHKTSECRRKTWQCKHCNKTMNDPKSFHKTFDCPEKPEDQAPRKKSKIMVAEESDDDADSIDTLSAVKVKTLNAYSQSVILDSGANTHVITPTMTANFPTQTDSLRISGIGKMRINSNSSCYIHDIKHYILNTEEGIISISQLCQRFNILVVFSKHNAVFTNEDQSIMYAEGILVNGLYTIEFHEYCSLLSKLLSRDTAIVNVLKHLQITKKCEAYITRLHKFMGHATADKMTNSIRTGITLPDPSSYDKLLNNTDVLCQMITKYYDKKICIACKIILHRNLLHQPNITLHATIPFEEISFDYKPADVLSYDNKKGTFIGACVATDYTMQFTVKSSQSTFDALKHFVQIANSFGFKIRRIRYDAATTNDTAQIQEYLNTRGIRGIPIAVGRQFRNFVEKIIDKVFKIYNVIQASQCLLNISYWPRGLDTAISYHNTITNAKCTDSTPHEVIIKRKPRIQQYHYGQPVLINKQKKHFTKEVDYIHENILAIVCQIDNPVTHGVRVIACTTGKISEGYYDMLGTVEYDQYDKTQRQEIQQRFSLPSTSIQQLPSQPNMFQFIPMVKQINERILTDELTASNLSTTMNAPTDNQIHDQQLPQPDGHIYVMDSMINANITQYLTIQRVGELRTLHESEYQNIPENEKDPKWHKTRQYQHRQQWINAAINEITKLDTYEVGTVVRREHIPKHIKVIPTTLVLSYKQTIQDDETWGYTPRARLAGRGDLELTPDESESYAPTTYISTVLILIALAVQESWILATFDVIGAFLKTPITEELYISLPGDILEKTYAIKLHKYLYGLRKANNKFNQYFHQILLNFGLKPVNSDICLYANDDIRVAIHVDDGLLIARDTQTRDNFLQYLDQQIGIEAHTNPKQYLKLELIISPDKILIHQQNYINHMCIPEPTYSTLQDYMPISYNTNYPIPNNYEETRLEYMSSPHCRYVEARIVQELVGALIYVIYSTRGALQLIGHYLAKYQSNPTEFDLHMTYHTYLHLKAHMYVPLVYTKADNLNISLISDGAHMKNIDTSVKGQLGYLIIIGNCNVMVESKAAARPTRSATETETQAGGNGLAQMLFVTNMLNELNVPIHEHHYYTDCLSLIKLINRKQQLSKKARHFANEIAQFKLATHGIMQLKLFWVPTALMIADLLTKLRIPVDRKLQFTEQIMQPILFFNTYHQHSINLTYNLFKKVRFQDEMTVNNNQSLGLDYLDIIYDDDIDYFNEIYHANHEC